MALANMFAMQQMQNNQFQNMMMMQSMQGGPMLWGGASQLLGPAMMMGGFQIFNMMTMMMMAQMMQQAMARQAPPSYYPPPEYRPYDNYSNPHTGLRGTPPHQAGGTFSGAPVYGPEVNGVPDHGAGARYPEFAAMKRFAHERGSLDGTFVTQDTSLQEDQANLNRLTSLIDRSSDEVIDRIRTASPRERAALQDEELKMQARLDDAKARGIEVAPSEKLLMQADYTHQLWKKGMINDDLGQRNAELREMLVMQNRADANEFLKFGERPPPGMARNWVWESPFNPSRAVGQNVGRAA